MSVVLDTSFVLALMRRDDEHHGPAVEWVMTNDEDLVTTPLAVAEMDRLAACGGAAASAALWQDLDSGAYGVRWWADALAETLIVARRHPDLGLTRASLVALAGRLRTDRIAAFDQHFLSVPPPGGEAFVVLPADA